MPEHPESFPVNALVPIPGTPLEGNEVRSSYFLNFERQAEDLSLQRVSYHTLVRTIATARIVLPTSIIRLAAGRNTLPESEQAMCFMAGANAVFTGEQMLTTPCKLRSILVMLMHELMHHRFALGRGQGDDGTLGTARHGKF